MKCFQVTCRARPEANVGANLFSVAERDSMIIFREE